MKNIIITAILLLSFYQPLFAKTNEKRPNIEAKVTADEKKTIADDKVTADESVKESTKLVQINGMVCAFCVDNLKKVFSKTEAVDSLDIDLKTKLLTLKFKPNKSLKDDEIKKFVKDAGYSVVKISNP